MNGVTGRRELDSMEVSICEVSKFLFGMRCFLKYILECESFVSLGLSYRELN